VLAACALIGIIKIKAMKIKNDVNNADVDIHCFIEFPLSDFRLFNGQDLWQTAYQLVSAQTNKPTTYLNYAAGKNKFIFFLKSDYP
jgi:hypothetical protein